MFVSMRTVLLTWATCKHATSCLRHTVGMRFPSKTTTLSGRHTAVGTIAGLEGNPEVAFEEWWLKMVLAYRRPYVFHLKFRYSEAREDFLAGAFQYVMADDSLRDSWEQCAADITLAANRMNAIVRPARRDSAKVLTGSEQEAYCPALDLSQLGDVIERFRRLRSARFFDCFQWWKGAGNYYDYETTHHLVAAIVKYECEDGVRRDSFPYTRRLLQHSTQAPHLAEILFRKIHLSPYLCLLLSDRATSHIGLIKVH